MTDSSPGLPRLFLTAASTLELVAVGAARGHHHHLCHPGEPALYKRAAAAVSLGAGQWLTAATTVRRLNSYRDSYMNIYCRDGARESGSSLFRVSGDRSRVAATAGACSQLSIARV